MEEDDVKNLIIDKDHERPTSKFKMWIVSPQGKETVRLLGPCLYFRNHVLPIEPDEPIFLEKP